MAGAAPPPPEPAASATASSGPPAAPAIASADSGTTAAFAAAGPPPPDAAAPPAASAAFAGASGDAFTPHTPVSNTARKHCSWCIALRVSSLREPKSAVSRTVSISVRMQLWTSAWYASASAFPTTSSLSAADMGKTKDRTTALHSLPATRRAAASTAA